MHLTTDALIRLIESWGLLLIFPLAIVEGPIVTVVAGWIVRLGLLPFGPVLATCVVADLVGDLLLYGLGRSGARFLPKSWQVRLGVDDVRLAKLSSHFERHGGKTLVATKFSHSFGFAILPAAGAAHMPVFTFLLWNLLGTLPKSLALLALGYFLGQAHSSINHWLGRGSAIIVALAIGVLAIVWLWRRMRSV